MLAAGSYNPAEDGGASMQQKHWPALTPARERHPACVAYIGLFAIMANSEKQETLFRTTTFAMLVRATFEESDLVDAAVAWLSSALPRGWSADRSTVNVSGTVVDPVITVNGGNGAATFLVEARTSLAPRGAEQLMSGMSRMLRSYASASILVVAPWLSTRTQELLRSEDINYLDLTGNAYIRASYPAIFLRSDGASRNPVPSTREGVRLRGDKAGRLIRTLVDVCPPYGVRQLATATELSPGYVSRLVDALDQDALIERAKNGEVVAIDYPALIRRWAENYDVLKTARASRFVAPAGLASTLTAMAELSDRSGRAAVTGSVAATQLAPIAAPALLLAYVDDAAAVAGFLGLLPAEVDGANVVLIAPRDPVVWARLERADSGMVCVAPSQVAVDCLTGPGRMPSEGEAVLDWMTANEPRWRVSSLTDPRAAISGL